mmetsp:Transcript_107184/g.341431  ORF Transcript_107184/g.341431 Transcript_107184/m.341431 type:complete len:259 (+) Transcript_107184:131-907(+)
MEHFTRQPKGVGAARYASTQPSQTLDAAPCDLGALGSGASGSPRAAAGAATAHSTPPSGRTLYRRTPTATRAMLQQSDDDGSRPSEATRNAVERRRPTVIAKALRTLPRAFVRTPTRTPFAALAMTGNSVSGVHRTNRLPDDHLLPSPLMSSSRFRPTASTPPTANSAEKRSASRCFCTRTTSESTAPRPESNAPAVAATTPTKQSSALQLSASLLPLSPMAASTEATNIRDSAMHCCRVCRLPRSTKTKSAVKSSFV